MNYVKSLNLFGVEAKEIPCITGSGAPTSATEGEAGCLYLDTATGSVYKCTSGGTWQNILGALAQADIEAMEDDINEAELSIDVLQGKMTTAEGSISALQGKMTTAEGSISALQGKMTTAEADIAALGSDRDDHEDRIAALENRSEIFIAEYGVTAGDELFEAYGSGKTLVCKYEEQIDGENVVLYIPLCSYASETDEIRFTATTENRVIHIYADSGPDSDAWRVETQDLEHPSAKIENNVLIVE